MYDLSSLSLEELKNISPEEVKEVFGPIEKDSFTGRKREGGTKKLLVKYWPFEIRGRYGCIDFVNTEKFIENTTHNRSTTMSCWPCEERHNDNENPSEKKDWTRVYKRFLKNIQIFTKKE